MSISKRVSAKTHTKNQLDDYANFCDSCGARQPVDSKIEKDYYAEPLEGSMVEDEHKYQGGFLDKEPFDDSINIEPEQIQPAVKEQSRTLAYLALLFGVLGTFLGIIFGVLGLTFYSRTQTKERKMCMAGIITPIVIWIVLFIVIIACIASDVLFG